MEQLKNELWRVSEQSMYHSMFKNTSTVSVSSKNCTLNTFISDIPLCAGIKTTDTKMCDKIIVMQLMFSPYTEKNASQKQQKFS